MQLEIADFPVREIRLGGSYRYRPGVLEVDREDLLALVRRDEHIVAASLEAVAPGDATRISGIRDIVEPRVKIGSSTQVFPGVIGAIDGGAAV